MKQLFKPGDRKEHKVKVEHNDIASFESGNVHPFYSTFALCRDVEWACRLFVLEMKDDDEEGIGIFIKIDHHAPALEGALVKIIAIIKEIRGNAVICAFEAYEGKRLLASGTQGQKILKKEKVTALFAALENGREDSSQ